MPSCFATSRCGPAFEIAQDDRQAKFVRETREFLVDHRLKVGPLGRDRVGNGRLGHDVHLLLAGPAAGQDHPGLQRRAIRNPIQPVADLLARLDRACPPRQHDEDRLERVVGDGVVARDPAANAQDHRPVPTDQPGERVRIAIRDERAEELAISAIGSGPGEDDPPESGHQAAGGGRHCAVRLRISCPSSYCPRRVRHRDQRVRSQNTVDLLQPRADGESNNVS